MQKIVLLFTLIALPFSGYAENMRDIYTQVLVSDPRLVIDSLGVEVGEARSRQAYGALLPQVTLSSLWTENKRRADGFSRDTFAGEKYILSIRQPIIDMQRYHAWQRSKTIVTQYELQKRETRSLVRLDTIERYFQLLSADDELALINEEKEATVKKLEQTETLYNKQLVKITDFYEVDARLDMLISGEVDAMQAVDLAKGGLSELTNTDVIDISPLNESTEFIQYLGNVDEWTQGISISNTRLMGLQKAIEVAKKNIKQQTAGHLPTLELQLSKQKSTIGFENALSPSTKTEVIALNLNIPLYSGGQTSARVYEAYQQLALAQAEFDLEYRRTIKEVKDAFLGVNAMARRIESELKSIESADKSYHAMNKSFKLGIATVSEVLDAQQVYSQAKRNQQQAKYNYIINKARLLHISGRLDEDAFYAISDWIL